MKIIDSNGHTIKHKRFNFFVSKKKYAELQDLKHSGGYGSISALVRALIEKREVIVKQEKYSLDRTMWLLLRINDLLRYMTIDMRVMFTHQLGLLAAGEMEGDEQVREEGYPGRREVVEKLEYMLRDVTAKMDPLFEITDKLSKIWLPE